MFAALRSGRCCQSGHISESKVLNTQNGWCEALVTTIGA